MGGCLDENTVLAFLAGETPATERARIEGHLKTCSGCMDLVTWAAADIVHRSRAPGQEGQPFIGALAPGSRVARYQILNAVGRGGMGGVYAAYHPDLDRRVALKVVHESGADSRNRQARLLREARAIARLSHPNVITVHDAGTFDDRVYIAMEFIEGQTVDAWLRAEPRGWREILDVFVAAGRGLAAAHAAGIIHRDFKPHNVMVSRGGSVRVMDFGLARLTEPDEALVKDSGATLAPRTTEVTQTSAVIGTPAYMSPEQFRREPVDARTDQFSFCVALYQALDGAHPFGGGTFEELMAAVTAGRPQPPSPKSAVPPWVRRILTRGLSVAPSQRWESMEELIAALSRDPARRRNRLLAAGVAVAAIAGVGFAARMPRPAESICHGGPARVAEAWDPDSAGADGSHRAATREAFTKTGLPHAAAVWDRTARILDKYVGEWLGMYRTACEATHVRGDQSAAVLDLRMACLSDRIQQTKALTDVFANATPTVVDNAIQAATALPSVGRCADVDLLRDAVPMPEDSNARARIERLKREVARVKALGDSGQCAAAAAAGRKVVDEAKDLGYLPLEGAVLLELARWGNQCLDSKDMLAISKRAALVGLASHDAEMAAQGAMFLGVAMADRTADVAQAREWLDVAQALIDGMSRADPKLQAWQLEGWARIYAKEGDTRRALDAVQRARPLLEAVYGPEHPDIALLLSNTGFILVASGRLADALDFYRRAEDMDTRLAGPDHPTVGLAVGNAAEVLNTLGRHEEARVASQRALAIWRHAGSSPIYEAIALTALGQALLGLGQPSAAVENLERARSLLGDDPSPYPHEVRFALARALWTWPKERPRAVTLAQEARAGYQRMGTAATELAAVDTWLRSHRN